MTVRTCDRVVPANPQDEVCLIVPGDGLCGIVADDSPAVRTHGWFTHCPIVGFEYVLRVRGDTFGSVRFR